MRRRDFLTTSMVLTARSLTEGSTVVVGHSLGSVVAYNVLRSDRRSLQIPLVVTVGCPLGVRAIVEPVAALLFLRIADQGVLSSANHYFV